MREDGRAHVLGQRPFVLASSIDLDFLALLAEKVPHDAAEHLQRKAQIGTAHHWHRAHTLARSRVLHSRLCLKVLVSNEKCGLGMNGVEVLEG